MALGHLPSKQDLRERIAKINEKNRQHHQLFLKAYQEIARHPDTLFVITEDVFPMDYIGVFDTPKKYPVTNMLYKDLLFNNVAAPTLDRFGMSDIREIWTSHHTLFWGRQTHVIRDYFLSVYHQDIQFSTPLPEFPFREVRKLILTR